MANTEWLIEEKNTLNGWGCLRHRVTQELTIFGKLGEIYQVNSTTYKMVFRGYNKSSISNITGVKYQPVDEATITFGPEKLVFYTAMIKAPTYKSAQVQYSTKSYINSSLR